MLSSVFVRTHTSVDKHTPICITNVLENGGPILLHFPSRLPAFVYVYVYVCWPQNQLHTRFESVFAMGPNRCMEHGTVGGGRCGPTLNPEETTHLFNGVNCVNGDAPIQTA